MQYWLQVYCDKKGKEPFYDWLNGLATDFRTRVSKRLARIENGNLGDYKSLGQNLFELRFDFGSGYRVYFTFKDSVIVFLLSGGDKSSQNKDITKARAMMEEYYGSRK